METTITSFQGLIKIIEAHELSNDQISKLLVQSIGLFENEFPEDRAELVAKLREYWSKYGANIERPLFLK